MKLDLAEIQGLVASGYGDRPAAAYALFEITDPDKARTWLSRVLDRLQFADFLLTPREEPPFLKDEPWNLALTYAGLARLGLTSEALSGFSNSFREGMASESRARQLGDDKDSAPERWLWGGPSKPEVHGVLCAFAGTNEGSDETDKLLDESLRAQLVATNGLELVMLLPAQRSLKRHERKEHFGFRDGVSNPQIEGLSPKPSGDMLQTGEVVLGYDNAYGKLGLTPRVRACDDPAQRLPMSQDDDGLRDFGKNGSYLVFRQLEQHVAAFWNYVNEAAKKLDNDKDGVWLASRMVGRWPNGSPVTLFPDHESPDQTNDFNDFFFSDHDDAYGQRCPIGSHIRRSNPRDTMLPVPQDLELCGDARDPKARAARIKLTDMHRIVRRGRTYGPPLDPDLNPARMLEEDSKVRGLYFLCFNANLRRQFEFVQATWLVNPNFAGLSDDPDPILASGRASPFPADDFTLQGCPARRVSHLPRVVETRGGAYFFMPSRSALQFLSEMRAPCLELVPPEESGDALALANLHVRKIQQDFSKQTEPKLARRGFHGKSHGIVRATVRFDADLAPSFRRGLFEPGIAYPAWVRFSSGSFFKQSDRKRDVRGLAIKLMGVPDLPRAALFERRTQDFVLIDAPTLMVGTVRQTLAFDSAMVRGPLSLLAHLATHLDEALAIARITATPSHLLDRHYSSVVPFAHGPDRAVRYVVRAAPGQTLRSAEPGDDGLRAALGAQLAHGDFALELCLQTRGLTDLPIEDARVDWKMGAERVATITLHAEGFGTPEQEALGERMSFNPWNALEAHRPLGGLNRARRLVYRTVYELRTRLNGHRPFEPDAPAEATMP